MCSHFLLLLKLNNIPLWVYAMNCLSIIYSFNCGYYEKATMKMGIPSFLRLCFQFFWILITNFIWLHVIKYHSHGDLLKNSRYCPHKRQAMREAFSKAQTSPSYGELWSQLDRVVGRSGYSQSRSYRVFTYNLRCPVCHWPGLNNMEFNKCSQPALSHQKALQHLIMSEGHHWIIHDAAWVSHFMSLLLSSHM